MLLLQHNYNGSSQVCHGKKWVNKIVDPKTHGFNNTAVCVYERITEKF